MKKTVQTMMTAAMFAATMNMIPSGTSDGTASASAVDYNPAIENWQDVYGPPVDYPEMTTATINTVPVPVYGPPVSWTTTPETDLPVPTTISTTEEEPVCVYGPPIAWNTTTVPTEMPVLTTVPNTTIPLPVYGPPIAWMGDINGDNRVDVFDMIELRKAYLNLNGSAEITIDLYRADINEDGQIGVADLVMLQNYLLGRTKKIYDNQIEEPKPTTPQVSYEPVQSTTKNTTTEPVPQPEYGAPVAFD